MQFKSVLAIVALAACSASVMAAPIQRRSFSEPMNDLVERDFEEDLRARFDELLIEEIVAREHDDTAPLVPQSRHTPRRWDGRDFDTKQQSLMSRDPLVDIGSGNLVAW